MSFLSGLLGSLGGPGNIIKSVGEFVSDSLGNLAKGEGWAGIGRAGSKAVKTLVGLPADETQVTNSRPMYVTNDQIPRSAIPGESVADARPIISTVNNQPRAKMIPVEKEPERYIEYRGTSGGFPSKKLIPDNRANREMVKLEDVYEPKYLQKLSKGQKRKLKKKTIKKFKNYMK